MTKERLQYFDLLKGIAIFLVVMGHVLILCVSDIGDAFLFKLVANVHMPIFFFIAGFFTYKENEKRRFIVPNIKRRFIQLIIPFFVVSTIWVFYFPYTGLSFVKDPTLLGLYFHGSKYGYWFTPCLFTVIILYSLFNRLFRLVKYDYIRLVFVIVFTYSISIVAGWFSAHYDRHIWEILSMGYFTAYFPVFFLGVLANKRRAEFLRFVRKESSLTISIIFVALYFCINYSHGGILIGSIHYLHVFATSTCIIFISFYFAILWCEQSSRTRYKNNYLLNICSLLGKNSLAIYLLHYFFLFPLTFMQQPMRDMGLGFVPCLVVSMVVAAVIVAVTLGANYIISQSKLLSLLLTGKNQYGK